MSDLPSRILTNAETIERLRAHIKETAALRERSPLDRSAWHSACEAFHQSFAELAYPGGLRRWEAFLAREAAEFDTAITFLEVDPMYFRSGYLKQIMWNRLKRAGLAPRQERRLEAVALSYLARCRLAPEFWYMVRYVRFRGSQAFWEALGKLSSADDGLQSSRAGWLLRAKQNLPVKNWVGRELLRARCEPGYEPDLALRRYVS